MKKIFIAIIILILSSVSVHAQRTAKNSWFLSADALCTFQSLGGDVTFGRYLLDSYWQAGVNAACRSVSQDAGALTYQLPYVQVTATGDFLYRLAAARTRWFTLNIGGGALLGVEFYDPKNQRPEGVSLSETGTTFIYGVDARLEMEFYAFRSFGFLVGGRMPLTFGSLCSIFNGEVSVGLRYNF